MRRRLTLAIVGVVALSLLLSGAVTLLLVRRSARQDTRQELVRQAEDIAVQADDPTTFRALASASRALRLEGLSRVSFSRTGVMVGGELPDGVVLGDLPVDALRRGDPVSGVRGPLAFAAVGVRSPAAQRVARPTAFIVVVLTRRTDPGLAEGGGWLVLSSILALGVAAAVGARLGRRITAPLAAAEATTRRIAAGDLAARVTAPTDPDPELASLAASINTMAANLERSRGLERQFLLAVSHDLRTPLTSIRGFAEAIADGVSTDHQQAAAVITAESRRLERLVADLLELAKLDARRFSLDVRSVDVAEVVAVTAEGFRPEIEEQGVALDIDTGNGRVTAAADPDRLAQVVANLVENASRYASDRIAVAVRRADDGSVVVVVDDDGPGIPAADLPHVFERFATSDRRRGTGLGLAIVAELAQAMGATVQATSPPGAGTRMEIRLRSSTS